jgi:hypothetical protein
MDSDFVAIPLSEQNDGGAISAPFPESGFFDWPPTFQRTENGTLIAVFKRLPESD